MPVYDYTYQTWKGERRGRSCWLAMPRFTCGPLSRSARSSSSSCSAVCEFLLRLAYQYLRVNEELLALLKIGANLPDVDAKYFRGFLDGQLASLVFSFTLTAVIASDLIHHAIVLYMSKPISRWEYFAGKFLTVFLPACRFLRHHSGGGALCHPDCHRTGAG